MPQLELPPVSARGRARESVCTLLFATIFLAPALVVADDSPQASQAAPLPEISLEQVAENFTKAREKYAAGRIVANFQDERDSNSAFTDREPLMIKFNGRLRYETDGMAWRRELDTMTYRAGTDQTSPRLVTGGYDGQAHYNWDRSRGEFVLGVVRGNEGISLRHFMFTDIHDSLPQQLRAGDWKFAEQRTVDGFRTYVLRRDREFGSTKQRQEISLSPRQDWLPVDYQMWRNEDRRASRVLRGVFKASDGRWKPKQIAIYQGFLKRNWTINIEKLEFNAAFPKGHFNAVPPLGVMVNDLRSGVIYNNDPWWPQIQEWMRKEYDWPPTNLNPLSNAAGYAEASLAGLPAPKLQPQQWIQGEPVTLKSRAGKVTLLYFSSGGLSSPRPKWVAALRGVHQMYEPLGLEIVEILLNGSEPEIVSANRRELQVPWPVAIDSAPPAGQLRGATFTAYKLRTYTSLILVDHQGRAQPIKPGMFFEQLRAALAAAGANDLPMASTDFVQMPNELRIELPKMWRRWNKQAKQTHRIQGIVRDTNGDPQGGIKIVIERRGIVAMSPHSTSISLNLSDPASKAEVLTFADGRFAFKNLSQGAYHLTHATAVGQPESRVVYLVDGRESPDFELSVP